MAQKNYLYYLEHIGKDPSRLIFEDELTGLYNRRFLFNYFQHDIKWDSLEANPVSLIMVDLDHFKNINDTYGHDVGDQALVWVANLLREVAGKDNLPIRYAGDEFMILLPRADKEQAMGLGEDLIRKVHERRMPLEEANEELAMTLSIGIASAPSDAKSDKALVQQADTALYYAKKAGRDRLANAGAVAPEDVFVKTAYYQLEKINIAGRKKQLAAVAEALKDFSRHQSQFLIAYGAAGMGKSMFLEAVKRQLSRARSLVQAKVSGTPQELFRPYYLIGNILVNLLREREDKGEGIVESLSGEEKAYLSRILPQVGEADSAGKKEEKERRKGIFDTLVKLIGLAVGSKPTILFIDDLHFADEATLLVLRQIIVQKEIPLFVCSSAIEAPQEHPQGEEDILERFCKTYGEEINLRRFRLTPLAEPDIVSHLQAIFPKVGLPKGFSSELERLTQGNPLFISEIVRKLVLDGKIALSGQQWVIHPLEEGYLPRSLEDIVRDKISALDEESRRLLDQASVFGDQISLSALTGSSNISEAKILEFIDKAVSQGLISTDFEINDETIRFLSRRVSDIAYGVIDEDVKQALHERVGNYQESLYEKDLLPSAATLAYHFRRSANEEKARSYEEIQAAQNDAVFNFEEVRYYTTGRIPTEARPKGEPLDAESIVKIPDVFRKLLLAVRNSTLYPPGSRAITVTNQQAHEALNTVLEKNEILTVFQIERNLVVNGQRIDTAEFKVFAEAFLKFLDRAELKGISFARGLEEQELSTVLRAFGTTKKEVIDEDFWSRFIKENTITHIELTQVKYAVDAERSRFAQEMAEEVGRDERPEQIATKLEASEQTGGLQADDFAYLPRLMRSLLNAARSIKLYPIRSKAIEKAVEQVSDALSPLLARRPAVTMAKVADSLLVNGEKVDTSEYGLLAKNFVEFLDSIGLMSITFLENISSKEIMEFIGGLYHVPEVGVDSKFWTGLAKEKAITHILFDRRLYEAKISSSMLAPSKGEVQVTKKKVIRKRDAGPSQIDEASIEELLEKIPLRLSDLLLKGDDKRIKAIVRRLFRGYLSGSPGARQKVISRCQSLMEGLNLGLQNQLAKFLVDPLILVLSQEDDPLVLKDLGDFLHRLVTVFLQFVEYPLATRILLNLRRRYREFLETDGDQAGMLARVLERPLEPKTQQLLVDDFCSEESMRQQNAAQVLGSLGHLGAPVLIDIIRREENLRTRQVAADLLSDLGPEVGKLLKREVATLQEPEQRLRLLEVVDGVTQDLRKELLSAFWDENPLIREEAFRVAERINNAEMEKLLLACAESENLDLAVRAIRSLGRLGKSAISEKLGSVLKTSKEERRLVACCETLAHIGDTASIELLSGVLAKRNFFMGNKYSPEVRASAASSLAQIDDPKIEEILAGFFGDKNERVRQVALSVVSPASDSGEEGEAKF
ncbi:MAG: diguanylate cyclase [Deltaproteobacteria bacterium]|nr:diguanylate cyclase [Deltaproteobacteria bacterium]MBW1977470.1 diguanylate cyclase [Deltaproteobacteria bacterium]MBW2043502.1 diguanylate cyclase [Deltaproteobacteria bacterium]MBW2299681.1 diguanylate cyclase [Deltaproteobacteria bacterium]